MAETSLTNGGRVSAPLVAYTVSVDAVDTAANTSTATTTATIPGLKTTDTLVSVHKTSAAFTAGLGIVNARISAANTVTIELMNTTAGAINETAATYTIIVAHTG